MVYVPGLLSKTKMVMSPVDIFTDHVAISTVFELRRGIDIPARRVSFICKIMHIYIINMSTQKGILNKHSPDW